MSNTTAEIDDIEIEIAECEHEWEIEDDSFGHEFGTEVLRYRVCPLCGAEEKEPPSCGSRRASYHYED